MNLHLYRMVLWLALPLVRLRLRLRARKEPAYGERVAERFGHAPSSVGSGVVWFHTVSAGETIAAAPLIKRVRREFPEHEFLVTTMTPTGSGEVSGRLGGDVTHCYAPYDFTFAVRRFFDRVQPRLLVLMETELWPNLIHEAANRKVPVLCVNARLSERSARGYAKVAGLTRGMLEKVEFIACQYDSHKARFESLGAPADRVAALGSVKFDLELSEDLRAQAESLGRAFEGRGVWIAASTHPGEEEIVMRVFQRARRRIPNLVLLLVPRHPVRADEAAELAANAGFSVTRQSACSTQLAMADVIVGDVMGSLLQLYGLADVAFLGGSFVPVGGHNPIEPALWEIPVLTGPQQFNFGDVMAELESNGGLRTVSDEDELVNALLGLLEDDGKRQHMGRRAHEVVLRNRGASDRVLELLRAKIAAAVP